MGTTPLNICFMCYIVYISGDTEAIEGLLESLFLALVRLSFEWFISFTDDLLEAPENISIILTSKFTIHQCRSLIVII